MLIVQRLSLKSAAKGTSLISKLHPCLRFITTSSKYLYNASSSQVDVNRSLRINEAWKQDKLSSLQHVNIVGKRRLFTETSHACAKCQKTALSLKYVYTKA